MPQTPHPPPQSGQMPQLTLDMARYQPLLDDETISIEDKQALLEALWSMVIPFVRLGWRISSVNDALAKGTSACGQIAQNGTSRPDQPADMVDCEDQELTGQFDRVADDWPQEASTP